MFNNAKIYISQIEADAMKLQGENMALRENQLSIVFKNKELAKESLEKVRKFIKENDTVYLSTHTPEALMSLKKDLIMKL